uniref:Peptidyl-prolyl cis-trans isomerase n=1 Tax=Globodera rostochiensis TaxID=31243 RepID=A0A914IC88_GLORO
MAVLIETTLGDLVIDLFVEERPNMCKNFLKLCKTKYYNLCQFFTIEPNYIAQTGDPTNAGRGGESIFGTLFGEQARFIEMEKVPKLRHSQRGIVSMVNNGDGMVGSQFFVTLGDELDYLDGKHCIFGQVGEGMDTVKRLNDELVDKQNRPYRDIRIAHTIVLVDPFDDPPRMRIPKRSPSPTIDLIKLDNQIALDERLDEDEGKTEEELRKELEVKDMKAQAQILEIVGDLHYAEERPPDNVLFVCKLNPVTTGEDLQVIFSRFGEIVSCGYSTPDTLANRDRCRIAQITLSDQPYEGITTGSTYGEMFSIALKKHGQLCIGLYRLHDQASLDSNKRYVITNPPAELRLLISDNVYVLEQFDFGYSKFETFGSEAGGGGGGTSVGSDRLFAHGLIVDGTTAGNCGTLLYGMPSHPFMRRPQCWVASADSASQLGHRLVLVGTGQCR